MKKALPYIIFFVIILVVTYIIYKKKHSVKSSESKVTSHERPNMGLGAQAVRSAAGGSQATFANTSGVPGAHKPGYYPAKRPNMEGTRPPTVTTQQNYVAVPKVGSGAS